MEQHTFEVSPQQTYRRELSIYYVNEMRSARYWIRRGAAGEQIRNGTREHVARVARKLVVASVLSLCLGRIAYRPLAKTHIPSRDPFALMAKFSFH